MAFRKYRSVVFVNGCFWHRHDCKYATVPQTNKSYWEAKFSRTVARDQIQYERLLT